MGKKITNILYVEDSTTDFELLRDFLLDDQQSINLYNTKDGLEALDYVFKRGPYSESARPDLILLDLNLPKIDGRQVLSEIKNNPETHLIPVIIFSSSDLDSDVINSYQLQANSYFTKPFALSDFESTVKAIKNYWINLATIAPLEKKRTPGPNLEAT
jgi:CheY-like chemotaxis protein